MTRTAGDKNNFIRSVIACMVFGITISACTISCVAGSNQPTEQFLFKEYEITLGSTERQSILTGFFLGGAMADIAVLHTDHNHLCNLRIYGFDNNTWVPKLDKTLHPEVLFVDVANIGGHDRLITYENGCLNWFDPESMTEHALIPVTSSFNRPRRNEIPNVDMTHDVNHDGRDDLLVPDVDGFWVFVQMNDGTFAEPVKIGPPPEFGRIYGADGYKYNPWSQSRVHETDYNQDGRSDLVFWNKDHFEVHLQFERGLFSPVAKSFTADIAFDSDNLSALATGDMQGKVLYAFTDLNGDGVGDLVVFSLKGAHISSKHSVYEVHFGAPKPGGGIVFAPEADVVFESDGKIQLGMDRHDFDGDGDVDLMFTTIDLDFLEHSYWKRIKGFMGDDIWLELEFYKMKEGRYPDTPNTIRRIALDGVPSHREPGWVPLDFVLRGGKHESRLLENKYPRAFNTTLRLDDLTGDGRADLLIGDHPWHMAIFAGVTGPTMFAQQHQNVAIAPPNDEEYTSLVDLNKDGKLDILMHHPFTLRDAHGAPKLPPGTEPHRVTILLAQ
ncbi:MAG: VCBS repeat-containing protein [Calditrichaeota bacterium]|nr:MAG: VCBS repeat-containing protein [Calditrichota bacterium]